MPQLVAKVLDVNPAPKAASPASPAGKPQTAKGASFRDALSQVQEKVKPKAAPAKTTGVSSKGSPLARAATRSKDAAKASEPKPARAGKRAEKAGARKGDEPAADVGASRKAKAPAQSQSASQEDGEGNSDGHAGGDEESDVALTQRQPAQAIDDATAADLAALSAAQPVNIGVQPGAVDVQATGPAEQSTGAEAMAPSASNEADKKAASADTAVVNGPAATNSATTSSSQLVPEAIQGQQGAAPAPGASGDTSPLTSSGQSTGSQPGTGQPAVAVNGDVPSRATGRQAMSKAGQDLKSSGATNNQANGAFAAALSSTSSVSLDADADGDGDVDAPPKAEGVGDATAKSAEDLLAKIGVAQSLGDGKSPAPAEHAKAAQQSAQPAPRPDLQFAELNHPKIVSGIHGQLLPDGGAMDIRLEPADLGAMHIRVEVRDGAVTASFQAADEQTAKLLSHSLGDLKTALEAQGVNVEKLHVSQLPKEQQPSRDGNNGNREPDREQQHAAQQEQQRRDMMRRMWRRLMKGQDPLDLVA